MDAVLSGPQGYTLLAIVIALAAYLRSVSAAARDKIEAILAGKDELWTPGEDYTSERIRILNKTRRLIRAVTHAFFVLAWLLAIRLCTSIFVPGHANLHLAFFDFLVLAFLTIAIFGMWIAHWTNRAADDSNFFEMTIRRKLSIGDEPASPSQRPTATDPTHFNNQQLNVLRWLIIVAFGGFLLVLVTLLIALIVVEFAELRRQIVSNLVTIIGLAGMGTGALILVSIFRSATTPIAVEAFFMKFEGGAGPVILWAIVFMTMVGASKLLWQ